MTTKKRQVVLLAFAALCLAALCALMFLRPAGDVLTKQPRPEPAGISARHVRADGDPSKIKTDQIMRIESVIEPGRDHIKTHVAG